MLKYQKGLEAVINAITNLTQIDEILDLAQAVITQLGCVLNAEQAEFVIQNVVDALNKNTTVTTNSLEGLKVVEIIENIYKLKQ